mmetsp:Transcript_27414/g.69746  ORF Transcript_27414/g.69746 Transcript_27414/m.69746 type:complete len:122 (+) Transcript_27414:11-376(+)
MAATDQRRQRDLRPHDIALLVMLGVLIAMAVGSTLMIATRARDDVSAVTFASEAHAHDAAVKGGFDGLDDKLVMLDDDEEATVPTPPLTRTHRSAEPNHAAEGEADEDDSSIFPGDPAVLF